jgi:hypothetical protein
LQGDIACTYERLFVSEGVIFRYKLYKVVYLKPITFEVMRPKVFENKRSIIFKSVKGKLEVSKPNALAKRCKFGVRSKHRAIGFGVNFIQYMDINDAPQ